MRLFAARNVVSRFSRERQSFGRSRSSLSLRKSDARDIWLQTPTGTRASFAKEMWSAWICVLSPSKASISCSRMSARAVTFGQEIIKSIRLSVHQHSLQLPRRAVLQGVLGWFNWASEKHQKKERPQDSSNGMVFLSKFLTNASCHVRCRIL